MTFSRPSTPSISLSSCGTMVFSTSEETPDPRVRNSESISSKKTMTGRALARLLAGPLEDQPDVPLGLADVLVEQLGALDVEEVATCPSWPVLAATCTGLGSQPDRGMLFITRAYRWLRDTVSQATGMGITNNIVDCYAALLRMWQPGDHVFLFGFSRGAYTVRCLVSVWFAVWHSHDMANRTPLFRGKASTQKIAKEAVKQVYADVSSPKDAAYFEQRKSLAFRFRRKYCSDVDGTSNATRSFGVFVGCIARELPRRRVCGELSACCFPVAVELGLLVLFFSAMAYFWRAGCDHMRRRWCLIRDCPRAIRGGARRLFVLADLPIHVVEDAVL